MKYTIQQYNMIADEFEMLGDFHTIGTETGVFLAYKGERLSGAYKNLYEAMTDAVENTTEIIEYHESTKEGLFSAPQTKAKPQPKPKKKQKRLEIPNHVCYTLVVKPVRKTVLKYYGDKVSLEEAEAIIDFLFAVHCSSQYKKPLGGTFDCDDVYPNIKKMIADGSITMMQAKDICMKHCSEYVFNTKIAA